MSDPESQRGGLFAIGGREDRVGKKVLLERFVRLCGGRDAKLLMIATASRDPSEKVAEYAAAFRDLGVRNVTFVKPRDRKQADDPGLLATLEEASGVFFMGGNQLKLVSAIGGTVLLQRLAALHANGLHVAGTSAGASALGVSMIARGKARSAARLSSIRMAPGFGLCEGLLIDQHFRERDRFGRLIAGVLCQPACLGIGLDEDTAMLIDGRDRLSAFGQGSVTLIDGSLLEANDIGVVPEDSPAAFVGLRVHVLTDGWQYDLRTGEVTAAVPAPKLGATGSQG